LTFQPSASSLCTRVFFRLRAASDSHLGLHHTTKAVHRMRGVESRPLIGAGRSQ
jgi:hypothetical protein